MKRSPREPNQSRAAVALGRLSASALVIAALASLTSCSTPPPPPPQITVKPPQVAASSDAPPLPPARWVDSSGVTLIGPALPNGTLVLLGGRRVLVAKDGSTRAETATTREGLQEIALVPTAKGEVKLVGRGAHGVYRFDDPLGAGVELARSEALIDHIGAGPGLVAVWDYQSYAPRFIDVDTGATKTLAGLPSLPARAIAFKSMKEGAAAFEAAGLAVTSDGGASWRLVDDGGTRDALRVTGVLLDQADLKAFVHTNGPTGLVDVAAAKLAPMRDAPEAKSEPALLKWVRVTDRDPLEVAAATGIEAPGGGAVIASHGLVARVDTKTGSISELVEFAKGFGLTPCMLTRTESAPWLGCTVSEENNTEFSDPFAVMRLGMTSTHVTVEPPSFRRSGETEVRTSPSGGVLLLSACAPDDEGDVCVRQPDGSWLTLAVRADLFRSGVGPLADGRAIFLRGLEEGEDTGEDADPSKNEGDPGSEGAAGSGRPRLVAVDATGKERHMASLGMLRGEHDLRAQSPIEEDADHTLRFVIADEENIYSVAQPPDHEPAVPQRIAQATHARLHAGRGLAIGDGHVMASSDGGSTWIEAPASARVREMLAGVSGGALDEPGVLSVSEVGAKVDTQLRIGWGQADALTEARPPDPLATLGARPQTAGGPERTFSCTTAGAAQSTPLLGGASEAAALFNKGKPPAPAKPQKGKNVRTSQASLGRAGLLDAIAMLEEQGTEKLSDPPKTWTMRWIDPSEVGSKVRTWTGQPPKGALYGTMLRSAAAYGGRALFSLRTAAKFFMLRVKSSGAVDFALIDYALIPTGEVQFGPEKTDIVAWVHDNSIVVWMPGEEPRVIANLGGRSTRTLGQPTKDGVPVLLSFNDLALMSALPIPPMPKGAAGQKTPPAPPPPAAIALDGWTQVTNIARKDIARLPACAAKPKGSRFVLMARQLNLKVDGLDHTLQDALYEANVSPGEACVAGISALVAPSKRAPVQAEPVAPPPKGKPAPKPAAPSGVKGGPVAWIRVDLPGKRAEGGARGIAGSARKLSCALEAKP